MKQQKKAIHINYFNIRGKAQVPRLLCSYLKLQYQDTFITPQKFMEEKKKNSQFSLPFLKDNQTTINGPEQMCFHIISKASKMQMMGASEEDKVKVKMYCWSIDAFAAIIGTHSLKKYSQVQMNKIWDKNIKLKLQKYEKACTTKSEWFLGYLTLIDFSIYELVRYMEWMFPGKMKQFENLTKIKQNMMNLPQIKAYQNSALCVKQISPQKILEQIQALSQSKVKKK